MKKKKFISIEGGEGAGKTTHAILLKKYIENKGKEVLLTREPGGTKLTEIIRSILLKKNFEKITPITELLLYEASRAQHVKEVILPALKTKKVVICDRFIDATVAYQGYGRNLNLKLINMLNSITSFNLNPLLTIYLDVLPIYGIRRANKNRLEEESINFHNNVRNGYLHQVKKYPNRIKLIKVQKKINMTQKLIREIVDMVL
ncbi:MAG: dTMP kinase [Endomicrobium sp.]|jgi:dTMP kinase|nr:dTMP kinase [Endomicrobium sp.]